MTGKEAFTNSMLALAVFFVGAVLAGDTSDIPSTQQLGIALIGLATGQCTAVGVALFFKALDRRQQ